MPYTQESEKNFEHWRNKLDVLKGACFLFRLMFSSRVGWLVLKVPGEYFAVICQESGWEKTMYAAKVDFHLTFIGANSRARFLSSLRRLESSGVCLSLLDLAPKICTQTSRPFTNAVNIWFVGKGFLRPASFFANGAAAARRPIAHYMCCVLCRAGVCLVSKGGRTVSATCLV